MFRYEPNCAGPKDLLRKGVTCWYDLRFPRKQVLAVWPPAPAESESPSTLPSDLASRSGAGLATKRWSEAKQKREPVLDEAESVARERWKDCDDDHAKMTSWLQSYTPDNKTLPFVDETLTKPVRERMAKVARELRKPVKGRRNPRVYCYPPLIRIMGVESQSPFNKLRNLSKNKKKLLVR